MKLAKRLKEQRLKSGLKQNTTGTKAEPEVECDFKI